MAFYLAVGRPEGSLMVQRQPPARKPRRPLTSRDRRPLRCESQEYRTHIMRSYTQKLWMHVKRKAAYLPG
jgi:hypothetical protein